jgi:four helix bundle protein
MKNEEKKYDLEERTAVFAERVRDFCLKLPKNAGSAEYIPQLIKSAGSPGANYIEANEKLGPKDFGMKIKTCLKESKESAYWLRLLIVGDSMVLDEDRKSLRKEALELVRIFSTILTNSNQ